MPRAWSEAEWDELFGAFPPDRTSCPTWADVRRLAGSLDRSADAVFGTWQQAERYCRPVRYHQASPPLRQYLDGRPGFVQSRDQGA